MSHPGFHLAQVNIARALYPMEDPAMHGFVSRLDEINALADATPGFVWRLQGEEGNALAFRVFDDPQLLINISVWESVVELENFIYRTMHVDVMRERKKWFAPPNGPNMALWWIPAGTIPTPMDARRALALLAEQGPTPAAFTFREQFAPATEAAA